MIDFRAEIETYRRFGIVLDSNLLLLLVVGLVDRRLAVRFKRTRAFLWEDFDLLAALLERFDTRWITPHILAEVSNFVGQLSAPHRDFCRAKLAEIVKRSGEAATPSAELVDTTVYYTFGLTDASISDLASRKSLVVTIDASLAAYLAGKGLPAVNFNHLRALPGPA